MRRTSLIALTIAVALILSTDFLCAAQQNVVASVVGTITSIDKDSKSATIKTDAGTVVSVQTDVNSVYLRIPANEKTLAKAVSIQFTDIAVGDRVLGHGTRTGEGFQAQRLVVLAKSEVDKKREGDLEEWRRRGIGGIVKDLNAQTSQINLELRGSPTGGRMIVVTVGADFRRYASGSLRFEDAQPSSFNNLKVGDQLRALGDKSTDGTFKAEKIVSGTFKTIGATVTEIDLKTNEIRATSLDQKKPVVISITKDSVLRRIPPPVAMAIAQKAMASKPASAGGSSAQTSSGQKAAPPPAGQSIDVQQVIDGLPTISAGDLRSGDVLAVTSAVEKDDSHLTAIKLVAGVDLVLKAMAPKLGKAQVVRLSAGLPSVFDFSVVQ